MKKFCLLVGFLGEKAIFFTHLEDPGIYIYYFPDFFFRVSIIVSMIAGGKSLGFRTSEPSDENR